MNTGRVAARFAAACLGLAVLAACSGQPGLDAGTAEELQARVAAAKQLTAQQDFPAALAELELLGKDVSAAAERGLMPAERKARAEAAIGKIRAELEAALAAAEPEPAPSAQPPAADQKEQEEDAEEDAEDARKDAEKQLEDAKKDAEKAKDQGKGNG